MESDGPWVQPLIAGGAALIVLDVDDGASPSSVSIVPQSIMGRGADESGTIRSYGDFLDRIHAKDRRRVDDALRALFRMPAGSRHEDEFRTLDGSWLVLSGQTMSADEPGVGSRAPLFGVLRTNDQRRRIDERRLRAIHELSLSARSAEIFVSMVAHDLKNPIGVIMGSAHAALEGLPGVVLRSTLERIRSNSERLGRMLQHLRDYVRDRPAGFALDRRQTDLRAIVDRVVPLAAADADVEVRSCDDCTGSWDDARLEHALTTLIEAAAERTAMSTGRPSLEVEIVGTDAREVVLRIRAVGALSSQAIENAFRPFGGDHAEHGLALFSARQAVVAHGGEVSITSGEGETIFSVTLPRRTDAITAPASSSPLGDELAAVEASSATTMRVTAALFGARPLYERAPATYWKLFERYAAVFDEALNRRVYRVASGSAADETRAIAEALGTLGAGPNEVAELHARALKQRLRDASPLKAQALVAEGRLLAFELMGHLVTWYRKRAIIP